MSMGPGRIVLLAVCILLLTLAFLPCQTMVLVQRSVMQTAFLLPHVERVLSAMGTPETHESMVRYLIQSLARGNNIRVPADLNEKLLDAAVIALSPQWVQEELLQILNKVLSVLRGKSDTLKHTIYLSRRKDVLISELSRSLPEEMVSEISASSSIIPNAVALEQLIDEETSALLVTLGKRYILFSLLFIYIIPAVLLLLTVQVGRYGWGAMGAGLGAILGGTGFSIAASRGIGPLYARILVPALRSLPREFRWIQDSVGDIVVDVQALGQRIGVVFAVVGGGIILAGVTVQLILSRTPNPSS